MDMEMVYGVSEMFIRRGRSGELRFILFKITDNILFAGNGEMMKDFTAAIWKGFDIRKSIIDSGMNFNGCKIQQDKEVNITMAMDEYVQRINTIPM